MICPKCGLEYRDDLPACPKCHPYGGGGKTEFYGDARRDKLSIKSFFKGAFRSHPEGAGARIFMAGTPQSTPSEDRMLQEWEIPWLYARIFAVGLLFALLCFLLPYNAVTLLTIGSLITPLSILAFYWEANIPRDIPLYKVAVVFLFGGALSIGVLSFLGHDYLTRGAAHFAAFTEEPAKIMATAIFLYWINPKHIFGGLLIGAAVGAGFAAFETIDYNIDNFAAHGVVAGQFTLALRSVLAIGGHVSWAAIEGGALAAAKGKGRLGISHFFSGKFLPYVAATMAMHFAWNYPIPGIIKCLEWVLLCFAAVYLSFTLLNKAIAQVLETVGEAKIRQSQPAESHVVTKEVILTAQTGPLAGAAYPLQGTVTIGRDPGTCQIVFPPDTPGVSRRHCVLDVRDDGVYIMDVSSKGTFLQGGQRLPKQQWVKITGSFCLGSPKIVFSVA